MHTRTSIAMKQNKKKIQRKTTLGKMLNVNKTFDFLNCTDTHIQRVAVEKIQLKFIRKTKAERKMRKKARIRKNEQQN